MRRHVSRTRRAADRMILLALAEAKPGPESSDLVAWDMAQRLVIDALATGDRRKGRAWELRHLLDLYLEGEGKAPLTVSRRRRWLERMHL